VGVTYFRESATNPSVLILVADARCFISHMVHMSFTNLLLCPPYAYICWSRIPGRTTISARIVRLCMRDARYRHAICIVCCVFPFRKCCVFACPHSHSQEKQKCYVCGEEGHTRKECPGVEISGRSPNQNQSLSPYKGQRHKSAGGKHGRRPLKWGKSSRLPRTRSECADEEDTVVPMGEDEAIAEADLPYDAPFIDACVHLHLLAELLHKQPGVDRKVPVMDALQLPPNFEAAICVFSDACAVLPEGASPHYRMWERARGDRRLRFAFGLRAADAAMYDEDVSLRLETYLGEVENAVAVGLVGLDYR